MARVEPACEKRHEYTEARHKSRLREILPQHAAKATDYGWNLMFPRLMMRRDLTSDTAPVTAIPN